MKIFRLLNSDWGTVYKALEEQHVINWTTFLMDRLSNKWEDSPKE